MIKITRKDPPRKKPSRRRRRKNKFRYNEDIIVKALWERQHEKCCYCEMKIPQKGHLKAVEHFKPQSVYKSLKNDWDNLLLACAQCNGHKSDKFPLVLGRKIEEAKVIHTKYNSKKCKMARTLLVDPSKENPEKYLDFNCCDPRQDDYGLICPRKKSKRGKFTIRIVGLFHDFYLKKHRTYLRLRLLPAYLRLSHAVEQGDTFNIENCKRDFELWMSETNEMAALARAFARHHFLDEHYDISIPD